MYTVASWGCEVTENLTQRSTEGDFHVWITVTLKTQIATKHDI